MRSIDDLIIDVAVVIVVGLGGWYGAHHYGATRYDAGYAAAIDAGREQHDRDTASARKTETDLRTKLHDLDEDAQVKEKAYEVSLEVAQRRVRTGTDRLRCPTAGAVQPAPTPSDRPVASGPEADGAGPAIVPEVAADLLGVAADVAGLVRRYDRLQQRFDACRAVNAQ